jgi:hypothetical protein
MVAKPLRPTEARLSVLQVVRQAGTDSLREIPRILDQSKPTLVLQALAREISRPEIDQPLAQNQPAGYEGEGK